MKHKISFLYYGFLILIIFVFSYMNSLPPKESFISFCSYYRPILRNTRVAAEHFQTKAKNKMNQTFEELYKKLGLK
jgi:hypothetical protein